MRDVSRISMGKSGFLFCSFFACGKDHTQLNYLQHSVHEFDTVMSCRQHRPGTFFSPFPGVLHIISCHHKFIIASHTSNSHPNSMTFAARHIPTISELMAIACDGRCVRMCSTELQKPGHGHKYTHMTWHCQCHKRKFDVTKINSVNEINYFAPHALAPFHRSKCKCFENVVIPVTYGHSMNRL